MLQSNPMLGAYPPAADQARAGRAGKKAGRTPDEYAKFWDNFGAVLKEGLYEDREHREELAHASPLPLDRARRARFARRVHRGDEAGAGGDLHNHRRQLRCRRSKSPQLEGFRARGVEVLLLTDPIDEFWVPAIGTYKDKPFKSVTRGGVDLDKITPSEDRKDEKAAPPAKLASLIAIFKLALGDAVKDVRSSDRLTDSAVCLVADEGDMDMHFERLLKQHRQLDMTSKRILELNPRHKLIERLAATVGEAGASDQLSEFAWLLLDQARIVEGEQLPDAAAFARRLSTALERGLSPAA